MAKTIKEVFDLHGTALVVDATLVRRIHNFGQSWINRNESHIAWAGGNLLGVHPIRFKTSDRESWFESILQVDEKALEKDLHSLPSIEPTFIVSSDPFNQSCLWLAHKIVESRLSAKDKHAALVDTMLVLQYKLISSLMAHYFPYPADESTAIATYAELSRKFALKVYGSWGALLLGRAEDIVGKESIHYSTYMDYNSDKAIVYMANDIQGRLREIVKSLTTVFYKVKESGSKFTLVSATEIRDGLTIIKDKHSNYRTYTRYVKEIITDQPSFIRPELTKVVCDAMHTMPPTLFGQTLAWVSEHGDGKTSEVDQLVDEVLNHAYDYITHNRSFKTNRIDIPLMLTRLRALYMASRMVDPVLIHCKALADDIVNRSVKSHNPSIRASVRTGLQLYLTLRAFSMSYYT